MVTKELKLLLSTVGGPIADLYNNSQVLSIFVDMLWQECSDILKVKKIINEVFTTFIKGRKENQSKLIRLILYRVKNRKTIMYDYAHQWLKGHSLGLPEFSSLK